MMQDQKTSILLRIRIIKRKYNCWCFW